MHEIPKDHWVHFPVYFTAFFTFIGGVFVGVYGAVE